MIFLLSYSQYINRISIISVIESSLLMCKLSCLTNHLKLMIDNLSMITKELSVAEKDMFRHSEQQ